MSALVRPRGKTLPEPVVLGPSTPERTVEFVAWLRDMQSDTVQVTWQATVEAGLDTTLLHHLTPPADRGTDDAVRRWREAFRPALCYYRFGPGFVQVKDTRRTEEAARFLLDDPVSVAAFTRCLRPTRLTDLSRDERTAAEILAAERLLLCQGEWVTVLPSRMRLWPVPSHLV
jgi:hypothetical protein